MYIVIIENAARKRPPWNKDILPKLIPLNMAYFFFFVISYFNHRYKNKGTNVNAANVEDFGLMLNRVTINVNEVNNPAFLFLNIVSPNKYQIIDEKIKVSNGNNKKIVSMLRVVSLEIPAWMIKRK